MPKKPFASGAAIQRQACHQSPPLFSAFGLNFWPLGVSSLFVTPISGYAYVKVSNNKQSITPGEFKPYKTN